MQINQQTINEPYDSRARYIKVLPKYLDSFSREERPILSRYIKDMEIGKNVNGVRGKRSYKRLVTLLVRLRRISDITTQMFQEDLMVWRSFFVEVNKE